MVMFYIKLYMYCYHKTQMLTNANKKDYKRLQKSIDTI